MQDISNKTLGYLILIVLAVVAISYNTGRVTGRDKANSIFLDSAFIESCEEDGTSCIIETNQGQKNIACNEYDNCITQEKVKGEREKEMQELKDKIFKSFNDIN